MVAHAHPDTRRTGVKLSSVLRRIYIYNIYIMRQYRLRYILDFSRVYNIKLLQRSEAKPSFVFITLINNYYIRRF